MIAPTIEPSHPAGEIVALPDNRFSRNPPTNEPTMPNTIVPTHPIGSGPGTRNRAITPTIAPTMMKPMMPMMSMQSLPYVKYRRAGLQAACLDASGAAAPQNERVLQALETLVIPVLESLYTNIGYAGLVLAMTIESACIPLPSELVLPLAGWAVARQLHEPLTGQAWEFWFAVVAGVIGNTAGSLIAYGLCAAGGRPLLERYGRYILVSPHDIDLAERWFARYGDATVFFTRLLPVVRTFISLPAGIARMPL